ncbi:MAG: hypothetical protein Q8L48_29785 [Archangium sp.]|nr:hypothetical protein [Archangium sp.]
MTSASHRGVKALKWISVMLGVLACACVAGSWWYGRGEKQRMAALAARLIKDCPADQIQVLSMMQGDAMEEYALDACGKPVRLQCLAPDFTCFVAPR